MAVDRLRALGVSVRMSVMIPDTPALQAIRKEAQALSAVLASIEEGRLSPQARALVQDRFQDYFEPTTAEEKLIKCAQARLLGVTPIQVEVIQPAIDPTDRVIFETTARAWMRWALNRGRQPALRELKAIPAPRGVDSEGRAIHLMALHPWVLAVTALLSNDLEEARRQYRRTTELSAQLGTETNAAIQWTYAASFLSGEG